MAEYYTPGVYVEEISTFPASVVRVATAVPVFIGYTEVAGSDVLNIPTKVRSLIEYELLYGGEPTTDGRSILVHLDAAWRPASVDLGLSYYLYQSLRQFYANGGGDAYILSVGTYSADGPDKSELIAALAELEKADEPTLILVPDAFAFTDPQDLGDVQAQVLMHCAKMQDRFGMFDVLHDAGGNGEADDALAFRNKVGNNNLSYGAAYYPEVLSSLGPLDVSAEEIGLLDFSDIPVTLADVAGNALELTTGLLEHGQAMNDIASLQAAVDGFALQWAAMTAMPTVADEVKLLTRVQILRDMAYVLYSTTLSNSVVDALLNTIQTVPANLEATVELLVDYYLAIYDNPGTVSFTTVLPINNLFVAPNDFPAYVLTAIPGPPVNPVTIYNPGANLIDATDDSDSQFGSIYATLRGWYLSLIAGANGELLSEEDLIASSGTYAAIVAAIKNTGYVLSPTAAVAGVYAVTDATRGVWKAPANVSLNAVADVSRKFQTTELDDLNMPTNGKAINAIRPFRGQGILVYGARTLAGNDNEWRYVSVRRLFLMVEESVRKACEPLVFEPNDANLWQRVRGMIENFLTGLWRDGALAGATTKDAFFVKAGIGSTMTAEDILEGKLIVEIGMAAVRPAEFVILKFMHKMQES